MITAVEPKICAIKVTFKKSDNSTWVRSRNIGFLFGGGSRLVYGPDPELFNQSTAHKIKYAINLSPINLGITAEIITLK